MTNNRTYRVHTEVNKDKYLDINLLQDYDELNILSLKIRTENVYKLHTSKYGCLVGRVLANGGVGIPNVKLSVFISIDRGDMNDPVLYYLYPYTNVKSKNYDGIRYNLLPTSVDDKCHQDIGTFPNKRMVLDDNNVIEIYDKYYKYTTTTNESGDYMIFGLPTGNNIIHSELDLSDIGILSQKPRDLYYKGYNETQFENSNQFKKDTNLDNLTQVISQDDSVYVYSFWGDNEIEGDGVDSQVKITRNDININYKFEPTCIFIGSIVADEKSQGFSKKCIPTDRMGKMDRLTTGKGTIEMIRKTPTGDIESFSIQGNDLIDGNGTWCYQIPMNLDYVKTDEYGNLVAAEDESIGIPTRTSVRFRISLSDYESDAANAHLVKILVPNNVNTDDENKVIGDVDYNFGTYTKDDSFRDLLWNNVYSVKQYIPRIQRIRNLKSRRVDRSKNFSGIKAVNVNGSNNPIPYNNLRVQLTFLFIFQCLIFKTLVFIVKFLNVLVNVIDALDVSGCTSKGLKYVTLDGAMCPETDGGYMVFGITEGRTDPMKNTFGWLESGDKDYDAEGEGTVITDVTNGKADKENIDLTQTYQGPNNGDKQSADYKYNSTDYTKYGETAENDGVFIGVSEDYFVKCVELQFAMQYEVIQFDFYNDWLNGCIYIPRWFAELKKRRKSSKIIACDNNFTSDNMGFVQQCAIEYDGNEIKNGKLTPKYYFNCGGGPSNANGEPSVGYKCHKGSGRLMVNVLNESVIYGENDVITGNTYGGGIVRYVQNMDEKFLYYLKPNEIYTTSNNNYKKNNLFATDIILLGSTEECNKYGIPTAKGYPSSTFIMPPPTIQIVDESQEIGLTLTKNGKFEYKNKFFYDINTLNNEIIGTEKELSGIDWGYNPFSESNKTDGYFNNERSGHFLEISCINSYTNRKTCVNLQRICELGAEMAQSHYIQNSNSIQTSPKISTTGIIGNREVIGNTIRTKFATLNSQKICFNKLKNNYDYYGLIPNSFDGNMSDVKINTNDLIDTTSKSYLYFRFGVTDVKYIKNKFSHIKQLTTQQHFYSMPIYENSFYFYFGLRDGNTAIDRLYSEYFSECTTNSNL